jgi:hypothetical protein
MLKMTSLGVSVILILLISAKPLKQPTLEESFPQVDPSGLLARFLRERQRSIPTDEETDDTFNPASSQSVQLLAEDPSKDKEKKPELSTG